MSETAVWKLIKDIGLSEDDFTDEEYETLEKWIEEKESEIISSEYSCIKADATRLLLDNPKFRKKILAFQTSVFGGEKK